MSRRVVITGMGIVSSIGNNKDEVADALYQGKSGIVHSSEYEEFGFRSHVHAPIDMDVSKHINRKLLRFMGDAAAYAYVVMEESIADAQLPENILSHPRTGLIAGSGGSSYANIIQAVDTFRSKGARRVGPYMVSRTMASTVSANLTTAFGIKGVSYSLSSACATSAHCIGTAYELIQCGKQDVVFAGGAEELHWSMSLFFDAMGALSSRYNDTPESASRPYDDERDGFVISGGGGMVVLESLEHALERGAPIYAEIVGYSATSDGYDMVAPSGEGAARSMTQALADVDGRVDYLNTHATGTHIGDIKELEAVREVFEYQKIPPISSTKSLTGHSLGAAGVHETIYTLLMMNKGFITPSANIFQIDEVASKFPVVTQLQTNLNIERAMTNSFGFGGANATLVFQRYSGSN